MRAGRWWSVVLLLFVVGRAGAQGAAETVYHLHGVVVDGVTKRPIGRALVVSQDGRLGTMTDGRGRFSVDLGLPGKAAPASGPSGFAGGGYGGFSLNLVMLRARRPGYLEQGPGATVDLAKTPDSVEVVLPLMPAAAIRGQVTAEGLTGAQRVPVLLLKHQVVDGMLTWSQVGQQVTHDGGRFEFSGLQPGEYTVMSTEWAGEEPFVLQGTKSSVQYPPAFAGNSATLRAAAKLHVPYGGVEEVALRLRRATYYPVRIPVGNRPENGFVQVTVLDEERPNGYRLGWDPREGAVTGALPPGSYTVLLAGGQGPQVGSARVALTVEAGPVLHVPVTLVEGGRIAIRVHEEFTVAEPSGQPNGRSVAGGIEQGAYAGEPVSVDLRSVEGGRNGYGSRRPNGSGGSELAGVQPGTYHVMTNATRGYVASLSSGGVDLLQHPLVVADGGNADPIDVTLRNDGGKVEGTVDFGKEAGVQFALVYLLPSDGSERRMQGFARPDGKLEVSNVPPGSYRALAFRAEEAGMLPYRDAAAMRAYDGKGTAVTVRAGGTETVALTLMPVVMEGGRP